jgi:hypothetical protein
MSAVEVKTRSNSVRPLPNASTKVAPKRTGAPASTEVALIIGSEMLAHAPLETFKRHVNGDDAPA